MSLHPATPVVFVLSAFFLACGASGPGAGPASTPLAFAEEGDWRVELLSPAPLAVGQNRVAYRVLRDGEALTRARLTQLPLLRTTTTQQGCPTQDPPEEANGDRLFEGLLVFPLPSSDERAWTLSVELQAEGDGATSTLELGALSVGDSAARKLVDRGGEEILLTVGFPAPPRVGENEVVVTAHLARDETLREYVPVQDLSFVLTPEMPSMGHGSSGSVHPTLDADGLYRGTAVFSMAGDWVLHLEVRSGETSLATYDFAYAL